MNIVSRLMRSIAHALDTRSFLPSLYESISPDQMRSYALFRLALMYSCISITVIHSSRPWLPSGAAHSAVRAMAVSNLPVRQRAGTPRGTVSLFVCATIEPPDCGWHAQRERRRVEVGRAGRASTKRP